MLFHSDHKSNPSQKLADQQAARRGDARAFGRLVAPYREQMYALSFIILGDEQAAVAAAQAAIRLAAGHSATLPAGDFELWLLRWVVSACRARWRPASQDQTGTGDLPARDVAQSLQGRLCRLPLELRLALVLVDVTGLDYAQAATVLGARREQVSSWLAEGRARLTFPPDAPSPAEPPAPTQLSGGATGRAGVGQ